MVSLTVLGAVVLAGLLFGIISSIIGSHWLNLAIFLFTFAGFAIFTYMSFAQGRDLAAAIGDRRIDWASANPEIQRQNLNIEVAELSKILEIESGQISDLQSAYIVAENLALRQIQQEENVPLTRHVSLSSVPFDGALVKNDTLVCIEVSFLVAPDVRQEKIDAMLSKIKLVKTAFENLRIEMKVRLMLVLVTQLTPEDDAHLRSVLNTKRFSSTPVDIDIRLLDFEALQRIYVTDGNSQS